jgi:hypothetical protein
MKMKIDLLTVILVEQSDGPWWTNIDRGRDNHCRQQLVPLGCTNLREEPG